MQLGQERLSCFRQGIVYAAKQLKHKNNCRHGLTFLFGLVTKKFFNL
jgi:hypothetical protein